MELDERLASLANFYYVKRIDADLYKKLQNADRHSVTNIKSSALSLREALGWFMESVFKENHRELPAAQNEGLFFGFENSLRDHPINGINENIYSRIRRICNAIIHNGEAKYKNDGPFVSHQSLGEALGLFDEMLWDYYTLTRPSLCNAELYCGSEYNPQYAPVNDWRVLEVLPRNMMLGFDREIIGCSMQPSGNEYALIRQYPASAYFINGTDTTFAERETGTGKKISVFANHPSALSVPSVIETIDLSSEKPAQKKKLVSYPLGTVEPYPVSDTGQIAGLTMDERFIIMYDLARAIRFLHKNSMSHRGLTPNAVFFMKGSAENDLRAVITSLEHCKLPDTDSTVAGMLKKNRKHFRSDTYYSSSMLAKIRSGEDEEVTPEEWKKEDIYSLGAVFWYLLNEKAPGRNIDWSSCPHLPDDGLKEMFADMTCADPGARPDISQVFSHLKNCNVRDD